MAIFYDAPVNPTDLTAFVREVPTPGDATFLNAFPRKDLTTNTIDWAEITKTNRTARFRSFDARIHVSERDAGSGRSVNLLPLGSSIGVGEYERLQLEFARTGGTNAAALANAVYNDAESLTNEVLNRLDLAWGDVLNDGKLTINEEGYQGEADFGVPASHKPTAIKLWTDNTAKALTDYLAWNDAYASTNGGVPGAARVSTRVARLFQTNPEVVAAIHGNTGRTRVTLAQLNDLLASEGLAPVQIMPIKQYDVDGVVTPVIADDRILFTPENLGDLGYTAWGVSATALELVGSAQADLTFENASGIVGVVLKEGPPFRQTTFVDAVAMPVLADAKKLMIADVA
ncbi:major capsid protein [Clavibacter capsici]|uniref:major capsid protein n=1 Tax=Clavibacter capsici TaxID=1874630 RepID=UPI0014282DD2|nr:major capsid protein [Clavibacter capsici]QIS38618.1 major capsid protein E [Clavibacter capsici]